MDRLGWEVRNRASVRGSIAPVASVLLAAVLGVTACAPAATTGPEPAGVFLPGTRWPTACEGIPLDKCRDMAADAADSLRPNDPPLRSILIRCTKPPCTQLRGDGETIYLFVDGTSRVAGSWGYASPGEPPIAPVPTPIRPPGDWQLVCQGVPRQQCEEFAVDSYQAVATIGVPLRAIIVRCTVASCTATEGTGETIGTFADGSQRSLVGWSYAGPLGP